MDSRAKLAEVLYDQIRVIDKLIAKLTEDFNSVSLPHLTVLVDIEVKLLEAVGKLCSWF